MAERTTELRRDIEATRSALGGAADLVLSRAGAGTLAGAAFLVAWGAEAAQRFAIPELWIWRVMHAESRGRAGAAAKRARVTCGCTVSATVTHSSTLAGTTVGNTTGVASGRRTPSSRPAAPPPRSPRNSAAPSADRPCR